MVKLKEVSKYIPENIEYIEDWMSKLALIV